MNEHVPAADGRCVCHAKWGEIRADWIARELLPIDYNFGQDADADAAASPVLTARVYAADSARTVPGTSACCEGGGSR